MNKPQKFVVLLLIAFSIFMAMTINWNAPAGSNLFIWGFGAFVLCGMIWVFADKKKRGGE